RDARRQLDAFGVLGRECERQERVVPGFGGEQTVVAHLLELPCAGADIGQRRCHDSGVDLHAPDARTSAWVDSTLRSPLDWSILGYASPPVGFAFISSVAALSSLSTVTGTPPLYLRDMTAELTSEAARASAHP